MPYVLRSYEGQDEWTSYKWLAHMDLGHNCFISFFGNTKEEAERKAREWYAAEEAKQKRIDKSENLAVGQRKIVEDSGWSKRKVTNRWGLPMPAGEDGSNGWPVAKAATDAWLSGTPAEPEHGMTGKVWMLNSANHRVRINASEQADYEAKGYIRGGPRSVWQRKFKNDLS